MTRFIFSGLVMAILATSVACGSGGGSATEQGGKGTVTLKLGYFPNITHSQAIVGLARGTFADKLGPNVKIETKTFNAGPSAIEALFAGEIDATYIGPNPAINGYVKSEGTALRIVAGATSGGALLVVRSDSGIEKPADFAGKKIASPQLGNTQDVALRAYLLANGLAPKENGGNVSVTPVANPDILTLFQKGEIDGAWVPEPWATRLVKEAGGRVFLDERDLWPNGDFVTAHLIVRTEFLQQHPDVVENLLRAHVEVTQWINANPEEAKRVVNEGIKEVTGAALPDEVVAAAWQNLRITYDPIASSLRKSAADAFSLGFLGDQEPDLSGIYDLDLLNKVLKETGLPTVSE
jgi:NitT/TauT family transport system substrate-binding protein